MDAAIPISELIVELIAAIGVGPFILVIFALLIVGLAPGIINRIFDISSKKKSTGQLRDAVTGIQAQVGQIFDIEHLSMERISKINEHVNSIQNKMRNVMREDDVIRFASVKLGIEEDFKTKLLKNTVKILTKNNGHFKTDLRLMINSQWQDLKNDLNQLNAPINLKQFIMHYDEKFSESGELYNKIVDVAESDNINQERKKERISILVDSTLMDIRNDLSSKLTGNSNNRS